MVRGAQREGALQYRLHPYPRIPSAATGVLILLPYSYSGEVLVGDATTAEADAKFYRMTIDVP